MSTTQLIRCWRCKTPVPRHQLPSVENRKDGVFCDRCLRANTAQGDKLVFGR